MTIFAALVMPGLVPGILFPAPKEDGRDHARP